MSRFTLKQLLPKGPILSAAKRRAKWGQATPSMARYQGPAQHAAPLLPIMPFGIAYDLDLVIVTNHPEWDMHELARLRTPEGPVWFAKDARSRTLEQSIVSGVDDLAGWLPELPVPRKASPVQVRDTSTHAELRLALEWENPDGELTQVDYRGPYPTQPQAKRNGSTMGHSRATLMAALDLSHRSWASSVSVRYDGTQRPLHRLLFVKPFAMSLLQTQGGFLTGSYTQKLQGDSLITTHLRGGDSWPQPWTTSSANGVTTVSQTGPLRTLTYRYLERDGALELFEITVSQYERTAPTMRALFAPALPDLRRPFSSKCTTQWVMDINGQENHALGEMRATWGPSGPTLQLTPTAPWWVADRPMQIAIQYNDVQASVDVSRVV
ncbi:MAG: hypothetical protein ACPGU1_18450 [Myxococcota bacterium]